MPEEPDKKLEYLKHDEVKTMQKDIAGLREGEAKQEREKISQIKTEEEVQKEREREQMAQKAALEKKLAEEAAIRREEETKRLREEREKQGIILEKEAGVKEGVRTEGFKEAMRETQLREEEERKRFLERVAQKADNEARLPAAPPPVQIMTGQNLPKPFKKPSVIRKISARIVLIVLILAVIAGLASFWYWYFKVRTTTQAPAENMETKPELIIPTALMATEASRTLEVSMLPQILKEDLGNQQFTRLIVQDTAANKVLGIKEFFEALGIKTPETFYDKLNNDFTLFIYSAQGINRLGLIARVTEPDLMPLLTSWESTMEQDIEPLSALLGKTGPAPTPAFRQATYKNIVFRYLSFPEENLGVCWTLVDNYFILTFSGESIIKTIDKINE